MHLPGHSHILGCSHDGEKAHERAGPGTYRPLTSRTPNTENDETGFYSSSFYGANLLRYLEERTDKDQPFFAFLPFPAPHWPLQCAPEDRDLYRGMYDDGPEALRVRRLQNLIKLGLISKNVKPHEVVASTAEWDEMTGEEKKLSARAMEVYAGMVTSMNRAVGKVVHYLTSTGELDNTVVIFMSDNGAEGAALEAMPVMGTRLLDTIDKYYDNSYENLGNHNSFCWLGPRWAQASTAPNRLYKCFTTEGGIRVPMLLRYPPMNALEPGSITHAFTTCMDIAPTFLALAGVVHPNASPSHPRERAPFRGRPVYGMRGKSWIPHLRDGAKEVYGDSESEVPTGWEFLGRASVRRGQWKAVFIPNGHLTGTGSWQLYDLHSDQGETHDLAQQQPGRLKELLDSWNRYQEETGTVFGPGFTKPIAQGHTPSYSASQLEMDPVEDQKAWMTVGVGKRFADTARGKLFTKTK